MLHRLLRAPLLLMAVTLGVASFLVMRSVAPRLSPSSTPTVNGFSQEDIIGTYDGDPIILAGTRSVTAIFEPTFVGPSDPRFGKTKGTTYNDDEPVMGLTGGGVSKAYSTWFLNDRELVHDKMGADSLLVTW